MPEEEQGQWQEFNAQEPDPDDSGWGAESPPPEEQPEEDMEFFESFNPEWRQPFQGLVYLGHLEGKVEIPYHSFTVKTLTTGEKIKVVELIRHLEDSIGYARAYRAAIVAAALLTVDGKPLLVGSKNVEAISQRYRYITDNWYDFVVDLIYEKVNEMEGQVLEVLKELGIYDVRREVAQVDEAEGGIPAPQA